MSNPFAPHGGQPSPDPAPTPGSRSGEQSPFAAPAPSPSPGSQGWGAAPDTDLPVALPPGPTTATTGPWHFVSAAAVTAVLSIVLGLAAWLGSTATEPLWLTLSGLGWFTAGIVTFILLGLHIQADTRRQAAGLYVSNPTQTLLYRAALGVGAVGVLINAVEIALWFGKAYGG